jgi:hypothetical protein
MFVCKDCAPEHVKWMLDLAMGVSHGPCECCHITKDCLDYHGDLTKEDCPLPSYGADKYDKDRE